jgi:UDP-2-acetamido-2,6-beta-L-arabino-hexul-4-ose reductase
LKNILITGGRGFLGRNLVENLYQNTEYRISTYERGDSSVRLQNLLSDTDIIFHLAGENRPHDVSDYEKGNVHLTQTICSMLENSKRAVKIVFSSSSQATLQNPYGTSKRKAEQMLEQYAIDSGACVRIYRLRNLFGKWSRPNYNSVTATFCYNIANELPIVCSDWSNEIELCYIDDVVEAFITEINGQKASGVAGIDIPTYKIKLGDLAGRIQAYHEIQRNLVLPDFSLWFNRALYATYLSYVQTENMQYNVKPITDSRGSLAELIKQEHFGQIFVSRTKPGVTRGNHYHHTKTEKFFVVEGHGLIRMRSVKGGPVFEYPVKGSQYKVVDIPPGFTHSLTNIGSGDLVTLFWSDEIFDPNRPDTYYLPVDYTESSRPSYLVNA